MNSLLPPNASELERKITQVGKAAFGLPTIRVVKDIDDVPAQFLPFIAWQKSVDYWDENWQEALKRNVIKESRDLHRLKGTPAAIKKALEPFGYEVTLIEWFKAEPNLVPGTFNLELDLIGKSLDQEVYNEVNRLVSDAKAASRHLGNLTITTNPIGTTKIILVHQTAITFSSEPRV